MSHRMVAASPATRTALRSWWLTWRKILDKGVLVRDNGVPGWLRVSAGTPAENDAFLDAVRELKKEQSA